MRCLSLESGKNPLMITSFGMKEIIKPIGYILKKTLIDGAMISIFCENVGKGLDPFRKNHIHHARKRNGTSHVPYDSPPFRNVTSHVSDGTEREKRDAYVIIIILKMPSTKPAITST